MNLSVILPILNIDENLDKCIESVLNQTEKSIEFIISCTKKDYKILTEKYKNIKIISNDTTNIELLKNNAIKQSKGKYISIIESNMILDKKMYKNMLFQQSDICLCSYKENNKKIKLEIFSKLARIIKIDDNIHNKIFKRELVINNQFSSSNVFSNKLFIYKAVANANTFGFVHEISYITIKKETCEETTKIYKTFDEIFEYYKIKNLYTKEKSKLEYICVRELLGNTFKKLRKLNDKKLLEENWNYLVNKFPNWNKNLYVKRMPGLKNFNIKITNKLIYDLKSNFKW